MRQNPDFIMKDVAGNRILIPIGRAAVDLDGMITLNDIGVFVWQKLSEDLTYSNLLESILHKYDVEKETADADLRAFLETLKSANAIVE